MKTFNLLLFLIILSLNLKVFGSGTIQTEDIARRITVESKPCLEINEAIRLSIAEYINSLGDIAVEFLQIDNYEQQAQGYILLKKQHGIIMNYFPPYPLHIISSTKNVMVYNFDTKESYFNNLDHLALKILLKNNFTVTQDQIKLHQGNYSVNFYDKKNNVDIELLLRPAPLVLREITMKFDKNNFSKLILKNIERVRFPNIDIFSMKNPKIFGSPRRYTKEELFGLFEVNK